MEEAPVIVILRGDDDRFARGTDYAAKKGGGSPPSQTDTSA